MFRLFHWFHSWGKWEEYKWTGYCIGGILSPAAGRSYRASELRQRRTCSYCGKKEDELITDL